MRLDSCVFLATKPEDGLVRYEELTELDRRLYDHIPEAISL
jgi:hypothetical protein